MKETAVQINERKIRNGLRKQAEKIQREKEKVWDRLKDESVTTVKFEVDGLSNIQSQTATFTTTSSNAIGNQWTFGTPGLGSYIEKKP